MAPLNQGHEALSSQYGGMYPLAYLQHMSVRRAMEWDLSKFISGVFLGKLGVNEAYAAGHERDVFGLHPDWSGLST